MEQRGLYHDGREHTHRHIAAVVVVMVVMVVVWV